ncbi:MAG: hypothetical protein KC496_16795, partial [Anaerolineae bacterium]|nr:hypothetical protein [Anaerolineae bacterium]
SGRDVLKHILRREMLKDTTIVVVTANNLMAQEMRPLLREGDHFFLKPVRMMDLQQVAREARSRVLAAGHLVETVETQAISTVEHPALADREAAASETTEDKPVIDATEETIVNRSGMLWMKEVLADAAAKRDSEAKTQPEEETVAERPDANKSSSTLD